MEEQIKRAVRNLNISYVFFWVLPAFLLGAGEFDLLPVGALVDNVQATYYFETIGILLTALCVPLALKLFSLVLKKENRPHDHSSCIKTLCAVEHGTPRIARSGYHPQRIVLLSDSQQHRKPLYADRPDRFPFLSAQREKAS